MPGASHRTAIPGPRHHRVANRSGTQQAARELSPHQLFFRALEERKTVVVVSAVDSVESRCPRRSAGVARRWTVGGQAARNLAATVMTSVTVSLSPDDRLLSTQLSTGCALCSWSPVTPKRFGHSRSRRDSRSSNSTVDHGEPVRETSACRATRRAVAYRLPMINTRWARRRPADSAAENRRRPAVPLRDEARQRCAAFTAVLSGRGCGPGRARSIPGPVRRSGGVRPVRCGSSSVRA